jgi:hypothetical protein
LFGYRITNKNVTDIHVTRCNSYPYTLTVDGVNGQLHVPATLSQEKYPSDPTGHKAVSWVSLHVATKCKISALPRIEL